ncbi:MAG: ATP-binding cassette domain-containing protein, partial [Duncaniella sp.]|nr:ATP-binding cassette domain-containing protein [Duncaniella sp.]
MKPYLLVEDLTKSYGDRVLFDSVSFGVNEGDKIGIIAKNGTGKSTLLRILSGKEAPDSGTVTFRNSLRVGFLDQQPVFEPGTTLMQNLLCAINPD